MDRLQKDKTLTEKIIEFIGGNPGITIKELAGALSISQNTARLIVEKLKARGLVRKEGRGLYLTEKGDRIVSKLQERPVESVRAQATPETSMQARGGEDIGKTERITNSGIDEKIKILEERLKILEERLNKLEEVVNEIIGKKTDREEKALTKHDKKTESLPKPVMSIQEAVSQYPQALDRWKIEGSAIQIGNLVVEKTFLVEFLKKFPLPVDKIDKLSPAEKAIFEELRREALIILHGGREYRLVKNIV
ncbi:winged helix-turn-helix transcriptional regulator [Thermogladius sp. 4427co]|uniref:winged helix-turn-helix transcriptional regulator n=1 Tax=Thermogladius sp. 4427co TaxID=3450718 RepID=UPI003F79AAD4